MTKSLINTFWRRPTGSFLIFVTVIVFIWGLSGYLIFKQRAHDRSEAHSYLKNTAKTLAFHLEEMLDQVDLFLLSTGNRFSSITRNDKPRFRRFLEQVKQESAFKPLIRQLGVTSQNGEVIVNTSLAESDLVRLNISDRDYFRRAKDGYQGLIFSGPLQSKLTGESSVVLARRMEGRDSRFLGIVFVAIPLELLGKEFSKFDTGLLGVISLRTDDFSEIVRYPSVVQSDSGFGNRNVSELFQGAMKLNPEKRNHIDEATTRLDGVMSFYSAQRLRPAPLWLFVGISQSKIDARLERMLIWLVLICLIFSALVFVGVRRLEASRRALFVRLPENRKFKLI